MRERERQFQSWAEIAKREERESSVSSSFEDVATSERERESAEENG